MFYTFIQNNSGGDYDFINRQGICDYVIVEADSALEANARAENIGIYFGGVELDIDCDCCGDRWSRVDDYDGTKEPEIIGDPVASFGFKSIIVDQVASACVHYKDGRKEWFSFPS